MDLVQDRMDLVWVPLICSPQPSFGAFEQSEPLVSLLNPQRGFLMRLPAPEPTAHLWACMLCPSSSLVTSTLSFIGQMLLGAEEQM